MGATLSWLKSCAPSHSESRKSSKQLLDQVDWTGTHARHESIFYDSNGVRLRPGDLLAFDRGDNFQHYALYLGKGMVIHVTPDKSISNGRVVVMVVLIESLEEVQLDSKFEVRNHDEEAVKEYQAMPRPFHEILEAAKPVVGEEIKKYDAATNNCEHYCNLWRYGTKFSTQVQK